MARNQIILSKNNTLFSLHKVHAVNQSTPGFKILVIVDITKTA